MVAGARYSFTGFSYFSYYRPMNTFSNAFRAEVVRMARKELKPELQGLRKALTHHRSEIAALKREVKALTEPPRVLWRLKSLRGLSHEVEQVFP